MVRFSNNIIGLFNLATFVLSIPILGGGIWLATKADSDCEKFLQWPVIAIGAFLMIVSLAGLVGACCRVTWLLWVYLAVNATVWTSTATNSTDMDCSRWSNVQDQLCYNCNSCKAGVLANLKHDWRKIAVINIVVLIALVVVYSVGCCAFRNNRRDERIGYGYKGYS